MTRTPNIALTIALASPLVALGIWYMFSFLPYLREVRAIADRGSESVRGVAVVLYPLLAAAESNHARRIYAMRQAYWSLVYERDSGGTLKWHANNFLWYVASYIHFDENQISGLWIECAFSRCDSGLSTAAHEYYGKGLALLSESELAGLLAAVRSPTAYAPGMEAGTRRATAIVEKASWHGRLWE